MHGVQQVLVVVPADPAPSNMTAGNNGNWMGGQKEKMGKLFDSSNLGVTDGREWGGREKIPNG